jgi:ribonuclease-3
MNINIPKINPDLLTEALTHRSWTNEHKNSRANNERLEFLGDAVLELFVSEYLLQSYPDKPEGFMTAIRANLVNTEHLALCAKRIGLDKDLLLSHGEEETGGRRNSSLLADCLEAVIGAIYLDQKETVCKQFILDNVLFDIQTIQKNPLKDAKSRLQEKIQSQGLRAPVYRLVSATGPDHDKTFIVEVVANHQVLGKGTGKNKAEAEQACAQQALSYSRKDTLS